MFNDRICPFHNLPASAIDLSSCLNSEIKFLCVNCLTERNEVDEVASLYDIIITINEIIQKQTENQRVQYQDYIDKNKQLSNQIHQYQQSINTIINKLLTNIEQDQHKANQQILQLPETTSMQSDNFYIEFIQKNYKGKYLFDVPSVFPQSNFNSLQFTKEGMMRIHESQDFLNIMQTLRQLIDITNQEESITRKITQKRAASMNKTLSLKQNCPIHQQETTMVILDKEFDGNRLICVDCIQQCQEQNLKKIISIKKLNSEWKSYQEKIFEQINRISLQREDHIVFIQKILHTQQGRINLELDQLKTQIQQSSNYIKCKQQQTDIEKHTNLQDLENEELLNRIVFLVQEDQVCYQIQLEQEFYKDEQDFCCLLNYYSSLINEIQSEFDQQVQLIYSTSAEQTICKLNLEFNSSANIKQFCKFYKNVFNKYPRQQSFIIDDFNYLRIKSSQSKLNLIETWINDYKNVENFQNLAALFINCIKRGESLSELFFSSNKKNLENKFINSKLLFQILYNNSSEQMKFMLLRFQSKNNPIPFLFINPSLNGTFNEFELFTLNSQLYYLIPQCYPVLNFSLSKTQSSYGKTSLINKIFYNRQIFETNDKCQLNLHSIDIMFDQSQNRLGQLAIADVHGVIPLQILLKILPFFKYWIIQMNTEEEMQENLECLIEIKKSINIEKCCFIVRNSKARSQEYNETEQLILQYGIPIYKMIDLTQKIIDREIIQVYNQISKFVFENLSHCFQNLNQQGSQEFLNLIQNYYGEGYPEIEKIQQINSTFIQLEEELITFTNKSHVFFDSNAFPIRLLQHQIENLKQDLEILDEDSEEELIFQLQNQIRSLKEQLVVQKPSKLLDLFQKIFIFKDNYSLHFKVLDMIKRLNEKCCSECFEKIDELYDGENIQAKYCKQRPEQIPSDQNFKSQKKQIKEYLRKLNLKQIHIEYFWRELGSLKSFGRSEEVKINLTKIAASFMKNGEPLEFMDRNQELLDERFLQEFLEEFSNQKNQNVLVVSILGPQSNSKKFILNKLFGNRDFSSQNKGITLQLINLPKDNQFGIQIDNILLLDVNCPKTYTNQQAQLNQKFILFALVLSDIILVCDDSEFEIELKCFVEKCKMRLRQMENSIPLYKLLSSNFLSKILINLDSFISFNSSRMNDFQFNHQNNNTWLYFQKQLLNQQYQVLDQMFQYDEFIQILIPLIKQFLENLQQSKQYLSNLTNFIDNIQEQWQNTIILNNFLEDEKDYKNILMQDDTYMQFFLNYSSNIPQKIQENISSLKNKNHDKQLNFLKIIERNEKIIIESKKVKYKQFLQEQFKDKFQIQLKTKRILKGVKEIYKQLQICERKCLSILFEEINKYEQQLKQEGFSYIDDIEEDQNKEIIKELNFILQDIQDGVFDNDEDILNEIIPRYCKLKFQDQVQFQSQLQEKFQGYQFVKNSIFLDQKQLEIFEDNVILLQRLIKQKNWQNIISQLENLQFCQDNQFPIFWRTEESANVFRNHEQILEKALILNELSKLWQGFYLIEVIELLLSINLYTKKLEINQRLSIYKIIGSTMYVQMFQFLDYQNNLKLIKEEMFIRMIKEIQQFQLKQIDEINLNEYDYNFQVLIKISTMNWSQITLEELFRNFFGENIQPMTQQEFVKIIWENLVSRKMLEECYFSLLFFFYVQYCDSFSFSEQKLCLENNLLKLKDQQLRQSIQIERAKKKFISENDEILQFLINTNLYYQEQQIVVNQQNLHQFYAQQQLSEKELMLYSGFNFDSILQNQQSREKLQKFSKHISMAKASLIFNSNNQIGQNILLFNYLQRQEKNFMQILKLISISNKMKTTSNYHYLEIFFANLNQQNKSDIILNFFEQISSLFKNSNLLENQFKDRANIIIE